MTLIRLSDEEESQGVVSETTETDSSASPAPNILPVLIIPALSHHDKELYRQYCTDSTYLQRGLGQFLLAFFFQENQGNVRLESRKISHTNAILICITGL